MFGYVRPLKGELKVAEYERFQAVYCGLCRTLKKRYGFFASFALNYDLAFFAAAAEGLSGGCSYEKHRCAAHLVKKRAVSCGSAGGDLAADLNVVLFYHKLDDAVRDTHSVKAWLMRLFFRRYYRAAKRLQPELCASVASAIEGLSALEQQGCTSLDRCADAFAGILSGAGALVETTGALAIMLYHVARWIYIIDACDDLPDDAKTHAFNAVAARYGITDGKLSDEQRTQLTLTLSHSLDAAQDEYEKLDFGPHAGYIGNVLRLGLYMVIEEVFK